MLISCNCASFAGFLACIFAGNDWQLASSKQNSLYFQYLESEVIYTDTLRLGSIPLRVCQTSTSLTSSRRHRIRLTRVLDGSSRRRRIRPIQADDCTILESNSDCSDQALQATFAANSAVFYDDNARPRLNGSASSQRHSVGEVPDVSHHAQSLAPDPRESQQRFGHCQTQALSRRRGLRPFQGQDGTMTGKIMLTCANDSMTPDSKNVPHEQQQTFGMKPFT